MRLASVSSVIERRLLVNYRVDPEVAAQLLPAPLRPQLVNGWAVGGICLIRLGRLRPTGVADWIGARSENAAHRIAVEWDEFGGRRVGVYIPRRDTGSIVNVLAGGRLFPGAHHRASFDVKETAKDLRVGFTSADKTARAAVEARAAQQFPGSALFPSLEHASDFFRQGSAGFSAGRDRRRLDGVQLHAEHWSIEPLEATTIRSSFFDDAGLFPPGSVTFDCVLLMRDIRATWATLKPMPVTFGSVGSRNAAPANT